MRSTINTLVLIVLFAQTTSVLAADIRVAVTTSFHNSGLSDVLLPLIKNDTGLNVQLVVVGTGQALRLGRAGDVDAILVHSKRAEEEFVKQGYGKQRREIMYNDFVLVGPSHDPAQVASVKTAAEALIQVANSKSDFVSRGDDSGTHRKEQSLWTKAGIDLKQNGLNWYRSVGSGMGATINTATAMQAYTLSDRASWLKFANKGDLKLLFSGDPLLFNQYTFIAVHEKKHPHVKAAYAQRLEDWLVSEAGQSAIRAYEIDGQKLFIPNAKAR